MRNVLRLLALSLGLLVVVGCSEPIPVDTSAFEEKIASLEAELATAAAQPAATQASETIREVTVSFEGKGETVNKIERRGQVNCAGNSVLRGYGFEDEDGKFSGFDIDFCKAIAAAVLGDAEAFEITAATSKTRFTLLQSGAVDVLVRNTTHTFSRDTQLGFDFAPITFYDGQGMMVRKESGVDSIGDLNGGKICVQLGTTTESNLNDYFANLGLDFQPVTFDNSADLIEAYDEGLCDGFTTDKSGLVSLQLSLSVPTDHKILIEDMSREPLGPATRHGDNNWNDVVSAVIQCTMNAELLDISLENVDRRLGGDDSNVQKLLGETGDLGNYIGLPLDFCYQVIHQVGNYEDIYNRNLGPDTPFNLPRGLNSLYSEGGILYPIPFK